MKFTLDTYAWIEYLEGSNEGEKVREILEEGEQEIFTPSIVLAELSDAIIKGKVGINWNDLLKLIKIKTNIIFINEDIAKNAGIIKAELRKKHSGVGLIDCIILSISRAKKSVLITGDPHLTSESDVSNINE